jgi:hypothetical protein
MFLFSYNYFCCAQHVIPRHSRESGNLLLSLLSLRRHFELRRVPPNGESTKIAHAHAQYKQEVYGYKNKINKVFELAAATATKVTL